MRVDEVPQDDNPSLGGYRRAVYARDADGRMVLAASTGWEVEEITNKDAVEQLNAMASEARTRVEAGLTSPLEYWMHVQRMDLGLLAQNAGLWRWRVRRHFNPQRFAALSPAMLERYANALNIPVAQLVRLP
ncbi:MAG: hypothetical protein QM776_03000 [Rhodocyclaceae bacterium]